MWTQLDDALENHLKLRRAAALIGPPAGHTRALGTYVLALIHANRYLTNGFVESLVFEDRGVPAADRDACVKAGLFAYDADRQGYQIHDFLEWNPTAEQVKARRARDRERKHRFQAESARTPSGFRADSKGPTHPPTSTSSYSPPSQKEDDLTPRQRRAQLRANGPPLGAWRDRCRQRGHDPLCETPTACALLEAKTEHR
jgi:hypothetical protein